MDEIVAVSKVSKTNIYYYFKSKEELLLAIVENMVAQYERIIQHVVGQQQLPVIERIRLMVKLLSEQDLNCLGGCPFLTLYTQTAQESELARQTISEFFKRQVAGLEPIIAEGINNKELNPQLPAAETAVLIVSMIEGGLFLQHTQQNPAMLEQTFKSLAILLKTND